MKKYILKVDEGVQSVGRSMKHESHSIDIIIPVYNGASTIISVIRRLLTLPLPKGWLAKIIVIDDGSTDLTATLIINLDSPRVNLLPLPENRGRSTARALGAKHSKANFLLFLDADCQPNNDNYLLDAITELEGGAHLVFGPIGSTGTDFWHRYLADVEKKWTKYAENKQWIHAITSGNLLVERQHYITAGGFNPEYSHYGFEDRDLVARLIAKTNPRISFLATMRVHHDANNTVKGYCVKMHNAARYSAPIFFRDHPKHYRSMSYGHLDATSNNSLWFIILSKMSWVLTKPILNLATLVVDKHLLPYPVTKKIVQAAATLSYIYGTQQRQRDTD